MPAAYTSSQKQYISQFTSFTQAKDTVAARFLKAHAWNLDRAIDAYFQSPQGAGTSATTNSLNVIFDTYRDDPADSPDGIGVDGAMRYLGDIQVQLGELVCFGVAELLKSPSMGEFTREGFVEGWKSAGCDSMQKMISHAASLRTRISSQADIFRRVYRYAFLVCRLQGQRNLTFEIACDQWQLFFTSTNGGVDWNTSTMPWLDWYLEFLDSRGKRPVNKDLWEQTEVFMQKTKEDESLVWWSPDGAWPGTLDDFVVWVKEKKKRVMAAGDEKNGEAMELE